TWNEFLPRSIPIKETLFMMVLPKQNTLSAYRYRVGVTISLSPVERPGFLFYLLFVGERSPE
ncbi:hypothetical protein LVW25_21610, partial [Klebsiella pneumoniae]|uniref:hypothetical protein n=1 Tax=Klebsiella pneumoniae TaxID=573 RepID=UPI001D10522D